MHTPLLTLGTPGSDEMPPPAARRYSKKYLCLLGTCAFFALVLPAVVQYKIKTGIRQQVVLDSPRAPNYAQFLDRTVQGGSTMEYYMFNITNPDEVLLGSKPNVEELGPFIYDSKQYRYDLKWNSTRDTLAFRQRVTQTFNPEKTRAATKGRFDSDTVQITTINILFLGMKAVVGPALWHLILDAMLWTTDRKRLFDARTVKELIMGYKVTLTNVAGLKIELPFPGLVPNHTRNEDDPEYVYPTVLRVGAKDMAVAYDYVEYGVGHDVAKSQCPWSPLYCPGHFPCCGGLVKPWGTEVYPEDWNPSANAVRGTSGEQFRPWLRRGDQTDIVVWSSMLMRALRFHNRGGATLNVHGIEMLQFVPRTEFWENATQRPSNHRYHQWGPAGLVNATAVQSGAPMFASLPHFLRRDPALLEAVDGLNPDPAQHELFLAVEEHTGMTFREHQRIMISAQITGRLGLWFPELKDAYVPVAWFDQVSEISHKGVSDFLDLYHGLSMLYGFSAFGFVGLALTLGIPPVHRFFVRHKRSRPRLISAPLHVAIEEVSGRSSS